MSSPAVCGACKAVPTAPHELPCGHTHCFVCLDSRATAVKIDARSSSSEEQSSPLRLVMCPTCQKMVERYTKEAFAYVVRSSISPDFVCHLCHDPLVSPRRVTCDAEHVFCEACISLYFARHGLKCPTCAQTVSPTSSLASPDPKLVSALGDLHIYCKNKASGCTWNARRAELAKHLRVCEFSPNATTSAPKKEGGIVPSLPLSWATQNSDNEKEAQLAKDQLALLDKVNPAQEEVVGLNVGGHRFYTTLHTLCQQRGSLLAALFGPTRPLRKQADGCVFLDRSPEAFSCVLEWLRSGVVPLDLTAREAALVQAEARFWQLGSLVSVLRTHPSSAPPPASPRGQPAATGAAHAQLAVPPASPRYSGVVRLPLQISAPPQTPRASAPLTDFVALLLKYPRSFFFPPEFAELSSVLHGEWLEAYRASRHGFAAREFHALCGGRGETVVVYQDKNGFVFGGYTSQGWSGDATSTASDSEAFLFTLHNPHGIEPTVFVVRNAANAVSSHPIFGPSFGKGDIFAPHNANVNQGSFDFPHDFTDTTGKGRLLFTGSPLWTAKEIVVFVRSSKTDAPAAV